MAFDQNKTQKSKNQFSARIMTNNGNMVCWAHLADDMARKVFGVSTVAEIPYAAAAEKLPELLDNERTHVIVKDMFAELTPVAITDY